ncbi:aspartyl/asparaginyl beta-hydroxylase domain-containing protein [Dokdonella ginsengisoli]|uniref:Aspartyl/asparaginyl beta-hydroxylase domain-containing protein n=1 Tax=Dokdonella ginsengisoli TaxID=363846 RepID=A0ABV9QW18_9GAMM
MKLPVPFIQLPLSFDAQALAAEIAAFDESLWRPHPTGMAGNSALPLAAVDGDPARGDSLEGPMRPTPALQRSPYLRQVLGSLGAVLGRIRLMRLSGRAEVEEHVDLDYYWNERVRVHVPIVTQPTVRFSCGGTQINMAEGECWIFDTWRMHHVLNDADRARVHLVVDSIGGPPFWDLVNAGRPHTMPKGNWSPRRVAPQAGAPEPVLAFESVNSQSPMSYWELRDHVTFLLGEAEPHPRLQEAAQLAGLFVRHWQALWFRHGADEAGLREYRDLLAGFFARIGPAASEVPLRNGVDLGAALRGLLGRAVRRPDAAPASEETSRGAPRAARA